MLGMMNNKGKISIPINELTIRVLCDVRAKTAVDGAVYVLKNSGWILRATWLWSFFRLL
jgi:hypothetical protein